VALNARPGSAQWLYLVARALGFDREQAQLCMQDHVFSLAGCRISLFPLEDHSPGRWWASALVPRPEALDADEWMEVLLKANRLVTPQACMAFALNKAGHAVLLMRVCHTRDASAVACELRLFGAVWSAVGDWSVSELDLRIARRVSDEDAVTTAWQLQTTAKRFEATARCIDLERLLQQSLQTLGASEEEATRATVSGHFRINDVELHVDRAHDGLSLLLSTPLPETLRQSMGAGAALRATASLLPLMGVALVRDAESLQVLANWSAEDARAEDLARYLAGFAVLPEALEERSRCRSH
jgi:hypothetical protein